MDAKGALRGLPAQGVAAYARRKTFATHIAFGHSRVGGDIPPHLW